MDKNIHTGHRERLKNRYLNEGLMSFEHHEVLELLLYPHIPMKDTNPIAHELITTFGSFSGVIDAHCEDLLKVNGMTKNAALYLTSLKDVFKIYSTDKLKIKTSIPNRAAAVNYLTTLMANDTTEQIWLLCLNCKSQLIKSVKLAYGSESKCNLSIKSLVETILRFKAVYVILSHNHPSGDATPSLNDINFTKSTCAMLSMLDIKFIDHYIIGNNTYYSFYETGLINQFNNELENNSILKIAENIENERLE